MLRQAGWDFQKSSATPETEIIGGGEKEKELNFSNPSKK